MLAGRQDHDAAIDSLLFIARRETLLLAIATGTADDDRAAVASGRLRWAIGSARQLLGAATGPRGRAHAEELCRIANRAQRWLVEEPPRSLPALGLIIDRLALRRRGVAIDARHASLADLDLDDLDLSRIELHGANLLEISARRAALFAADASSTRWQRCQLEACSLVMAVLCGSALERCDLSRANLIATSWHRAVVSGCALVHATLIDARLDRALFCDCDLRGADLRIQRSPEVATLAGAHFIRCDLRDTNWAGRELAGATFVDCKLAPAWATQQT